MTSIPLQISDISIIIPTLNEEAQVDNWRELLLLAGGRSLSIPGASDTGTSLSCGRSCAIPGARDTGTSMSCGRSCEVIIVDGGSSDRTVSLARDQGFRVEICHGGRGTQLNHGAKVAKGKVLLFLHADTQLPADFARPLLHCLSEMSDSPAIAGAFSLTIQDATLPLRLICRCANLRSRLLSLPYGDQAIFIRREDFLRLNGFPETPIMEDFIFINKARQEGKIIILPQKVTTSARRWQRLGIIRTTLINQLVILGYYAGIPLQKLASLYRR